MDTNQAERDAIAAEVFGNDAGTPSPDEQRTEAIDDQAAIAEAEKAESAPPDPWNGVPSAVRAEVESLREKVAGVERLEGRVKQAESRLGGVLNELHAAKEAAKAVKNAPSEAQMAAAFASQEEWDKLKEVWPEWVGAMEKKLAAHSTEILKQLPDVGSLRSEYDARIAKIEERHVNDMIATKHRDWRTKVNSPEFIQWHAEQGKPDSDSPHEVIELLDKFATFQSTRKTAKQINDERKKRLDVSQSTEGRKLPPIKSEADMSLAEIRKAEASRVWAD